MATKQSPKKTAKKTDAKHLVIVESAAKAKTLKKFLGSGYNIEASMGHVRDLPKSEMGVDIENNFEPRYITIRGKGELLAKLRREAKAADIIYLATDPDREGESISWHLMYALGLEPERTRRITFNEITKAAVKRSIKEARGLDIPLIEAQQARRVLDRIVGYKLSPLLWKKVKKGLSAGRVQSVALRIICDREEEIEHFVPQEFWTIDASLKTPAKKGFVAAFYGTDSEKIELKNKEDAQKVLDEVKNVKFTVKEVKAGKRTKRPQPPLTTSTMQQEASKSFGFPVVKTMQIAQGLYEGVDVAGEGTIGLVSYIRTDSVRISDEAYEQANAYITERYGQKYLPPSRNEYKSRGRAQDAHEAIRPTYVHLSPDKIKDSLTKEQLKLYTLIWERFVASQMAAAEFDTISAKITAGDYSFRASGSRLVFEGYRLVNMDEEQTKDNLPDLTEGQDLTLVKLDDKQHFTQPPQRFSEALLVKTLEENGVGRPSTYAPTIATILARHYVIKENKAFFPTELGMIVNDIMVKNFEQIVDIDFTAKMEDRLDAVEDGEIKWKDIISDFYYPFEKKLEQAEQELGSVEIKDPESDVVCEHCGRKMVIKLGRFGKFLACPGFPECRNTLPFYEDAGVACPLCGSRVLIKKSKKGRTFYGCENSPDCGFISWNKPVGESCPTCGGYLIEKGSRHKKAYCSNACGFSKEISEE